MYSPDHVFAAAHAIRPYLAELLQTSDAQALGDRLEVLLNQVYQEPAIHYQILDLLAQHKTTCDWIHFYMDGHYPVDGIVKLVSIASREADFRGDRGNDRRDTPSGAGPLEQT